MERIMEVIEQERIRRRFSQAVNTYDDHADAQKRICAHLVQLLTAYTSSHFRRVLEIGCGSGGFTRLLKQECQIRKLLGLDFPLVQKRLTIWQHNMTQAADMTGFIVNDRADART